MSNKTQQQTGMSGLKGAVVALVVLATFLVLPKAADALYFFGVAASEALSAYAPGPAINP